MNPRPSASRRFAVALAGVTLMASACGGGDDSSGPGVTSAFDDTGDCGIVVDMSVSSEKIDVIKALADSFNAEKRKVGDECVFVRPQSKASGGAATLLSTDWDTAAEGPEPVIWSPASAAWGAVLNQRLADQGQPEMAPPDSAVHARALVIAMPKPMATALGTPKARGVSRHRPPGHRPGQLGCLRTRSGARSASARPTPTSRRRACRRSSPRPTRRPARPLV